MANKTVSLILEGALEEQSHIRLTDFLRELSLFLQALRETERNLTARFEQATYYRVVGLSHSSPATIVVEAVPRPHHPDISEKVVSELFYILNQIDQGGKLKRKVASPLLSTIQDMSSPVGRSLSSVQLKTNGDSVLMNAAYQAKIAELLRPEETFPGSVRGMLEAINLHKEANVFRIYPDIGPSKVTCYFPPQLQTAAVSGVGRFVEVRGLLEYKEASPYPHQIRVEDIIVCPPDDQLPSLSKLRGLSPEATGKLTSEDFVRQIRDASA